MSLTQELSLFLILLSALPDRTFHIKNVAATSNFQLAKKMVILDSSGGNYLYVKELSGTLRKIGPP